MSLKALKTVGWFLQPKRKTGESKISLRARPSKQLILIFLRACQQIFYDSITFDIPCPKFIVACSNTATYDGSEH